MQLVSDGHGIPHFNARHYPDHFKDEHLKRSLVGTIVCHEWKRMYEYKYSSIGYDGPDKLHLDYHQSRPVSVLRRQYYQRLTRIHTEHTGIRTCLLYGVGSMLNRIIDGHEVILAIRGAREWTNLRGRLPKPPEEEEDRLRKAIFQERVIS